ncbi:MAG: hypothetical protein NTV38_15010 [Chloroflexi bacterium]|nr:hypothetical protein [Chloroflexota bacterium]
MEPMPGCVQSNPPPPPPQPSRKGLWIGLAIAAVLLCLCCIVVVGVYFFRHNIPYISNFFPSPTPTGLFYDNPSAGISLTYPATWQYSDSGDATDGYTIIFASSAAILNDSTNTPQTGAAMAILTNVVTTSDLSFTVNAGSLGDVLDYIATNYFSNLSQGQNLRTFTLSGYPAASGVYMATEDTGNPSAAYIITVLRNEEIIMFVGVCPQTEWAQHQPTFDSILNSVSIVTP